MISLKSNIKSEKGVALILVTLIIALASMLVINLTHSTFLTSRSIGMIERQLQAEYILKSIVEFSAAVVQTDSGSVDSYEDAWGLFQGNQIPNEVLSLFKFDTPGIAISLTIKPANAKFPLHSLRPQSRNSNNSGSSSGTSDSTVSAPTWAEAAKELFIRLSFDEDDREDETGYFNGRVFNSEEMLSNYIDYIDSNTESSKADENFERGIEGDLPSDNIFPKNGRSDLKLVNLSELQYIPGYTSERRKLLHSSITLNGNPSININVAQQSVLSSISEDLDRASIEDYIQENGPFTSTTDMLTYFNLGSDYRHFFTTNSKCF